MKRPLQIFLIMVTITTGLFFAYELIYANNSAPKAEAGLQADAAVNPPAPVTAPENPSPQQDTTPQPEGNEAPLPEQDGAVTPAVGEGQLIDVTELDSILILANKQRNLPESYVPGDLVTAKVRFAPNVLPEKKMMRSEAAEALAKLMAGADQENIKLYCVSGYRSYATQKAIYEAKLKATGLENTSKYVAYPGQSEHQTGLAMDLTNSTGIHKPLTQSFGQTKEGKWLQANAYQYGFIVRYPAGKESITGYNYEPWHIRYIGIEASQKIQAADQTLEEYLAPTL